MLSGNPPPFEFGSAKRSHRVNCPRLTLGSLGCQCDRRLSSSSLEINSSSLRAEMSISIMSPSHTAARGSPTAASGETRIHKIVGRTEILTVPGPPPGPCYRSTSTAPGWIAFCVIALTRSPSLSNTLASTRSGRTVGGQTEVRATTWCRNRRVAAKYALAPQSW